MVEETRIYKITGETGQLNVLEYFLGLIEYLGSIGASREQKIFIDGDGAVRMKVTDGDGNSLDTGNDLGYGMIKEISDLSYYFDLG